MTWSVYLDCEFIKHIPWLHSLLIFLGIKVVLQFLVSTKLVSPFLLLPSYIATLVCQTSTDSKASCGSDLMHAGGMGSPVSVEDESLRVRKDWRV
jgi:hypothetical protein